MKVMSVQKQQLLKEIEELPEEFSGKVIDYIEYLKYTSISNKAPESLVIKDEKDLVEKLRQGMEDTDNGKVCSIDEAFEEVEEILAN